MVDDERALVTRAARGDSQAFAGLYDRFVEKIYKYVYYRVGTVVQAEELTSQVFLKAWESIRGYRWTERPFAAWLYRIAHNLVIDYFRTHRPLVSIDELPLSDENLVDLDDVVQQHSDADMLRKAITHLTDDQQQVIVLKFLEGYSTEEIARMMGKDAGAIRALQHRALAALQKMLAGREERV